MYNLTCTKAQQTSQITEKGSKKSKILNNEWTLV